jgi:hypothetical protein
MSVSAKLQYDERRFQADSASANSKRLAARFYDQAEAVIKVGDSGVTPRLPEERRLLFLESHGQRPSLYSPNGPLSREQLDLVSAVGDSYGIDRLLPAKPVADGDSWPQDATSMAGLLALDSVAVCEVESVLEEFNASFAKVRLAGVVHGTADGASTEQEIRGVYLFDRRLRRITRLNLAVRERRSVGGATPGLDAVAKVQIKIEPIQTCENLTDNRLEPYSHAERSATRKLVFDAPALGFRAEHDRQWFVTARERQTITLRRIDGNDLVAQCTLAALPPKSAGRQATLEQFQNDVTYALGKSFGQLISSRQWQNPHGHYCYEVVVRGTVEQLPVEWHYFLVAQDSGHRVSLAVTIEAAAVERLGDADRALVQSLELFAPLAPAQTASLPGDQESL